MVECFVQGANYSTAEPSYKGYKQNTDFRACALNQYVILPQLLRPHYIAGISKFFSVEGHTVNILGFVGHEISAIIA